MKSILYANMDYSEKILQYKFKDITLFWEAVTHHSWVNENDNQAPDYQRLEFLGDCVLKLILTNLLYTKHPKWSEGKLTQYRSACENNKILGKWAKKLGLDSLIRHGNSISQKSNCWEQICAQVFEAILGAIWIDCGQDFSIVAKLYNQWSLQLDEDLTINNPKKELQEFLQKRKYQLPIYSVIKKSGPDHQPWYTVSCSVKELNFSVNGEGKSIKNAEQMAAQTMVQRVMTDDSFFKNC